MAYLIENRNRNSKCGACVRHIHNSRNATLTRATRQKQVDLQATNRFSTPLQSISETDSSETKKLCNSTNSRQISDSCTDGKGGLEFRTHLFLGVTELGKVVNAVEYRPFESNAGVKVMLLAVLVDAQALEHQPLGEAWLERTDFEDRVHMELGWSHRG